MTDYLHRKLYAHNKSNVIRLLNTLVFKYSSLTQQNVNKLIIIQFKIKLLAISFDIIYHI